MRALFAAVRTASARPSPLSLSLSITPSYSIPSSLLTPSSSSSSSSLYFFSSLCQNSFPSPNHGVSASSSSRSLIHTHAPLSAPLTVPPQEQTPFQKTVAALTVLNNLGPNPGAHKKARRIGRGQGSSKGKQSGRGMKGAKSRSGKETGPGFEGGQTPLYLRVKKYGFSNARFERVYEPVNLGTLQSYVDRGLLDVSGVVTMKTLCEAGIVSNNPGNGVKLLARGAEVFSIPNLQIEVSQCSEKAKAAVEAKGGRVTTIFMDKLGLRKFLRMPLQEIKTKFAAAELAKRKYYDIWHYIPDMEGRPTPLNPELYTRKPLKYRLKETKAEEEKEEGEEE